MAGTSAGRNLDFEAALAARFQADAARDVDVALALAVESSAQRLATFAVRHGALRFQPECPLDATFYFADAQTALAVLDGLEDPFAAFAAGRFRADGNLPLAFVLLGLFRSGVGVDVPA